MKPRMPLGDFLVAYLRKIGVTHLFGIPGDLVLRLFMKFVQRRTLQVYTFSHEPGAGFAVDGYARATNRVGVLCVTYGAGGHNVVNTVAGSFSERVPILVISGGPGEEKRKLGILIHHQAKEIESQYRIFREITCAARIITNPHTAAAEIDDVVRSIWRCQQPGYIEIHQDMVEKMITVPRALIEWQGRLPLPESDKCQVKEAVRETVQRYNQARRPTAIIGIETFRHQLARETVKLIEKMGIACSTTVLAKGAIPMDHPQYMGVHIGPLSPEPIRKRVDRADLVLNFGTLLTDMNLGSQPPQITRTKSIWAVDGRVDISYHTYTHVTLRDYVRALRRAPLTHHEEKVRYSDNLSPQPVETNRAIEVSDMLWEVNRFLESHPFYVVVAEAGDMLFAGLEVKIAHYGGYLAQGYYASMGFGVPGALGAQLGTGRRPLVLCGDGAFQMTGPEISHAPRYGLNPVVLVINNQGWSIFRPVTKRRDVLIIPAWPYASLAEMWGGRGFRVESVGELRDALAEAHRIPSFVIIEVIVDPDDLSPVTRKYIEASVAGPY